MVQDPGSVWTILQARAEGLNPGVRTHTGDLVYSDGKSGSIDDSAEDTGTMVCAIHPGAAKQTTATERKVEWSSGEDRWPAWTKSVYNW